MNREALATGLALIETVTGLQPSKELAGAWWTVAQGLSSGQWEAAVRRYLAALTERPREFPLPGQVLGLAPGDANEPMALEADRAWSALMRCSDYTPEGGIYWSARRVREELGEAVHRAMVESGGYQQLRILDDTGEFWARKRFVEAYARHRTEGLPAVSDGSPGTRYALPERTGEPALPLAAPDLARLAAAKAMPGSATPRPAVVVEATDEQKRRLIEALH